MNAYETLVFIATGVSVGAQAIYALAILLAFMMGSISRGDVIPAGFVIAITCAVLLFIQILLVEFIAARMPVLDPTVTLFFPIAIASIGFVLGLLLQGIVNLSRRRDY